eukprot:comp13235_c0_seq1/m.8613 comp13235_c0_seq1/g.8613  ORF comp13235_c0_seq1/g.8613 comp13235_c0_seq1/m.8613 type:complete len:155 (-) comp13235_c0_seq1:132-596(-)
MAALRGALGGRARQALLAVVEGCRPATWAHRHFATATEHKGVSSLYQPFMQPSSRLAAGLRPPVFLPGMLPPLLPSRPGLVPPLGLPTTPLGRELLVPQGGAGVVSRPRIGGVEEMTVVYEASSVIKKRRKKMKKHKYKKWRKKMRALRLRLGK